MSNRKSKKMLKLSPLVVSAFVLLIIGYVAWRYIAVFSMHAVPDHEKWGQFGDYFGGVLNPILSFLAFMAVLYSLTQQKISHQEVLSNHQFFELVSLTHEAARSVDLTGSTGHKAIGEQWYKLKGSMDSDSKMLTEYAKVIAPYKSWRHQNWRYLGSYFESVLFVLDRYVLNPQGPILDPKYFTLAIRSQMSMPERNILFYEMLGSEDWHKFMSTLECADFWRGGAHLEDDDRKALIGLAANYFSTRTERVG